MPARTPKSGQTNDVSGAVAVATPADKPKRVKGQKNFKQKNEKLGEVAVTVIMPEPSDADVLAYFGEGEDGEKNKALALKKFLTSARSARIGKFLRDATDASTVTADNALASFDGLKFGKRSRAAGGTRKVKRSEADLNAAVAALGTIPTDAAAQKEYLAKLLASINVSVEPASA